ncbi:Alpha/beta hydrolase fold-3 [Kalmanozyma brasiliensis GHG001]|uniref:Alpha/beta hydrolase fold-3 domain-containing protein n=1 Tax=Kalmanozyma brasiliensis (strain GHG001) TaxID=1365824 RepID=V5EXA1_KALBG|nr:Alpha/beta hydrolase fold-3 [Kalmanozyma brasiliensis GHG001]EST07034.1 Alpha/beta hydrolase fold-3 [Kalmanozyma brasiliensis GHG001]
MIDHLLGRPSTKLKRVQIFSVILFWLWFLVTGNRDGPSPLIRKINAKLKRFSPWQIVVFSSVGIYTIRHLDSLLGFGAPEPLARMYSRNFYRTTWMVTALDAGFATAMNIKPKWLRDIMSLVFSAYYIVYANEADEKLRKYRAFCTVEMMRTTWEKTTNPYVRFVTWFHRPSLPIARPLLIPRPQVGAHHTRPSKAWLFYAKSERQLRMEEELVLDFCGGGYICMNPQHHEERLRQLAKQMQKPVLAVDYCKAPEYPYPFALEECFDLYRTLNETAGKVIGMSGSPNFRIILTGDSAGGNLATGVVLKIIQYPQPRIQLAYSSLSSRSSIQPPQTPPPLPKPIGVVLSYPSLNFGFSSWMKPEHLRLLRQQSEVNLDNLAQHQSNIAASSSSSSLRSSRRRSAANLAGTSSASDRKRAEAIRARSKERSKDPRSYQSLTRTAELHLDERARYAEVEPTSDENDFSPTPDSSYDRIWAEGALTPSWEKGGLPWGQVAQQAMLDEIADREEKRAQARFEKEQLALQEAAEAADSKNKDQKRAPFNTRLTVTSMAGYFQDRIITQGMLRAMAILYIGPRRQPDLDHDYFLSPVLAPAHLLAEFPPVLFICGEKDPLCDDTVIMAGRIREAKLAKQADLARRRAMASARFGEGLRTTPIASSSAARSNLPIDPIEQESPEDWVQMRIIEGWSHGFLQMSSLMPEAKQVIGFLGTWMSLVFEEFRDKLDEEREKAEAQARQKLVEARGRASRQTSPLMPQNATLGDAPTSVSAGHASGIPVGSSDTHTVTEDKVDQTAAVAPQAVQEDADDEGQDHEDDDDEEDDGPIMVIPKKHRPGASHAASPQKMDDASPKPATRPLPHSQIASLRADDADTRAHSDGETTRPRANRLAPPSRAESETNLLADAAARSGFPGSGPTARRGSKNGPSRIDEKYRSMLVEEASLLSRRRDDVLFGLEGNSAVVGGEDDDDVEEDRGTRGSGTVDRSATEGESSGDTELRVVG